MAKILITGGAGFIGQYLAQKLSSSSNEIIIIDNFSRSNTKNLAQKNLLPSQIKLLEADCLNYETLSILGNDFDYIFHLAAIIGVEIVETAPFHTLAENIAMTKNMLQFAGIQKHLHKFLFSSTSEVYAGTLENFNLILPTPESSPLSLTKISRPRTSYMLSKIVGESLCAYSNVPFTIFRPHNIYGPRMGNEHVIPNFLERAFFQDNNSVQKIISSEQTRTFCFISDAIEMLCKIMISDECVGKTLNLGVQSPEINMGDLFKLCSNIVGKNFVIESLPGAIGSPERRCPDMTLTNQILGFKPSFSLEEGIKVTYEWYKNNIYLKK